MHQALLDEAAVVDSLASATIFVDLTKAFETARLQDVWAAGRYFQFPDALLRLMSEAFAFARS